MIFFSKKVILSITKQSDKKTTIKSKSYEKQNNKERTNLY